MREILPGRRHGILKQLYQVILLAEHTETESRSRNLSGALWGLPVLRPALCDVAGEVNRKKYPDAPQRYRFELVED